MSKYSWTNDLKALLLGRGQPIRSRSPLSCRLGVEQMEDRLNPTPTISALASNTFYVDESVTPQLSTAYVGYQVQGDGGTYSDVYAQVSGFSAGIGLAAGAPSTVRLGDLTGTNTRNAYFYLTTTTAATVPLTYAVTFYSGLPSQGNALVAYTQSITTVLDTIQAAANKFTGGSIVGPSALAIGSTFDVVIQGSTGTIGNPVIAYTPATLPAWLASTFQLQGTNLTFTSGDLNGVTVADALFYAPSPSATSNSNYTATFTFRAINTSATSTSLSPIAYIGSGTQVKHTDTGTWASLPAIGQVVNNLTITMTAGPVIGGESTVTLTVQNSGTVGASLDQLRATLAGLTYITGSSTLGGSAYVNPTTVGGEAVWSDAFSVAAGQNLVLTFRVSVPSTGNYQLGGYARIGDTQIDTTAPTNDNSPATVTVGADTTAPSAPAITAFSPDTGVSGDFITSATTLTLSGTAEPGSTVALFRGGVSAGTATANGSGNWSVAGVGPLADGPYVFTATATDAASNVSAASPPYTVTVDTIAPILPPVIAGISPDTGASATDRITNTGTVTVSGTAEPGSTVSLFAGATLLGTATTDGSGNWSVPLTLPEGTYNLTATATDAAGNTSAPSAAAPTIIDLTDPPTSTVTGQTPAIGNTTPLISGTAEPGSRVAIFDGTTLLGTATTDGTGAWSFQPSTPLGAGTHSITVAATDVAGNTGPLSAPILLAIRVAAPVSGVIFLDYNADGVRNGPDVGLPGRLVFIDGNGNGNFDAGEASVVTDSNGFYQFEELAEGASAVRVALFPSEMLAGLSDSGPVAVADLGLRKLNPAFPIATTADLFGAHNPDQPTALVHGLYVSVLGREGSAEEIQGWVANLQGGLSEAQVGRAFLSSDEYLGAQVDGAYRMFLNRVADDAGRAGWLEHLRQGMTYEEMAALFLTSAEYQGLYSDAESFVRSLYRNELGREGSEAEIRDYVARLEAGETRDDLARGFITSTEAYLRAIDSLYAQFLNRPGEEGGRANWLGFVPGGGRLTDLAVEFVTLPEFNEAAAATVG